jgi:hypothetical protein
MGNGYGTAHGVGEAAVTAQESVSEILNQVDKATIDSVGGKLVGYDGKILPW